MFGYVRLMSSGIKPKWQAAQKMFVVLAGAALAVSAAITSTGCDSRDTFLPPPPEGLRGAAAEDTIDLPVPPGLDATSSGVRSIEMVLDRRDASEIDGINTAARMQAGVEKVKLRTAILKSDQSSADQVELVREAVSRVPLALIVEPTDPNDVRMAAALQRARAQGTPVVLLNRPLATTGSNAGADKSSTASTNAATSGAQGTSKSEGARPFVLVAPPSFAPLARQLVTSAIRNAKNAQLDPKGGAVILVNTMGDSFLNERTTAIRDALKDNGITTIEEVPFSRSAEVGAKLLKDKLKANPKLVLVFATDGLSTSASRQVMNELIPERLFVQSAFAAEGKLGDMTMAGDFAAVAGFVPNRVIRKAIITAVSLSHGRDVPGRVEVSVEVHDSDEKATTPQSPAYSKARSATKKGSARD